MTKLSDFRAAMGEICAASSAPLSVGLHDKFDKAHDGIESASPAKGGSIFRDNSPVPSFDKR